MSSNLVPGTKIINKISGFENENHKPGTNPARKMVQLYKKAKLSRSNKNDWYVYYYLWQEKKIKGEIRLGYQIYKERGGLNRIKDLKERKRQALILIEDIDNLLLERCSPLTGTERALMPEQKKTIIETLDYLILLKKKELSPRSIETYKTSLRPFREWLKVKNMEERYSIDFSKRDIVEYVDWLRLNKEGGNRRFANDLNVLKIFFNRMDMDEIIETSPTRKVRKIKFEYGSKNVPPTFEQFSKIAEHLKANHPLLYQFESFIYYCGIRPNELEQVKIEDIHYDVSCIDIHGGISKNNKKLPIKIPKIFLKRLHIYKSLPDHYYLFGSMLLPGPLKSGKCYAAGQWAKFVKKKETGLGINRDQYSLKHRRAIDMKIDGVPISEIQLYLRHSTEQQTREYLRSMIDMISDETLDKTREF